MAPSSLERLARGAGYGSIEEMSAARGKSPQELAREAIESFGPPPQAKWSQHSLDPSNPSYRESVLHLPDRESSPYVMHDTTGKIIGTFPNRDAAFEAFKKTEGGVGSGIRPAQQSWPDFRQGHFSEPNVIAHARTSIQKDAQGRPVFLVDELQSDWGQKLRDGGARDEAKIAELAQRHVDASKQIDALRAERREKADFHGNLPADQQHIDQRIKAQEDAARLVFAELETAKAATPGHPLVNTTDQWTTTAIRRLLQQAAESKAEGIALTPGQLQNERFNLSRHAQGLRYDPESQTLHYLPRGSEAWNITGGSRIPPAELPSYIGKEMSERLLASPVERWEPGYGGGALVREGKGSHTLRLDDSVEIGGHGMRYAYDQMYPKTLEKQLRKLDPEYPGRRETVLLNDRDPKAHWSEWPDYPKDRAEPQVHYDREGNAAPFHYFPLTPRVRDEIAKGLPLFGAGAVAAPTLIDLLQERYGER